MSNSRDYFQQLVNIFYAIVKNREIGEKIFASDMILAKIKSEFYQIKLGENDEHGLQHLIDLLNGVSNRLTAKFLDELEIDISRDFSALLKQLRSLLKDIESRPKEQKQTMKVEANDTNPSTKVSYFTEVDNLQRLKNKAGKLSSSKKGTQFIKLLNDALELMTQHKAYDDENIINALAALKNFKEKFIKLPKKEKTSHVIELLNRAIEQIERQKKLTKEAKILIEKLYFVEKLESIISHIEAIKVDVGPTAVEALALLKACMPDMVSFTLNSVKDNTIHELHIASNVEDKEGHYARSQNKHRQYKSISNQENNLFGEKLVEFLSQVGANYNIGANPMSYVDYTQKTPIPTMHVKPARRSNKQKIKALRDDILTHKTRIIKKLVHRSESVTLENLLIDKKQLATEYPCVIIRFKDTPKDKNNETLLGYDEFVTHLMISQINRELRKKNLPLLDRRQSFGFLSPTMTDVLTGVRLSLGLTPNDEWVSAVIKGIKKCDDILSKLKFSNENIEGCVNLNPYRGGYLTGYAHKLLEEISPETDDLVKKINRFSRAGTNVHVITEPLDTLIIDKFKGDYVIVKQGDQYTINYISLKKKIIPLTINDEIKFNNLIRSVGQYLSIYRLNDKLPEDLSDYRNNFIYLKAEETAQLIYVNNEGDAIVFPFKKGVSHEEFEDFLEKSQGYMKRNKLKHFVELNEISPTPYTCFMDFHEIKDITGTINPHVESNQASPKSSDEYNHLYQRVMNVFDILQPIPHLQELQPSLSEAEKMQFLKRKSDAVGLSFFRAKAKNDVEYYDTSEDEEEEIENHEESKVNYYSPVGMSALFAPMAALFQAGEYERGDPVPYQCAPYSYFELNLSWNKTLSKEYFVRTDFIEEHIKNNAFKQLFNVLGDQRQIRPFDWLLNNLINELFKACQLKENEKNIKIQRIKQIYTKNILNVIEDLPDEKYKESLKIKIKGGLKIIETITDSFPKNLGDYLAKIKYPAIVQADVNPCVNREIDPISIEDLIKNYSQSKHPPKVLVIDTTSTTTERLRQIIAAFDQQSAIPILVTATSGLKNSELGLDCFPYGHNKIYRSAKTFHDHSIDKFYSSFCKSMKSYTHGTEYDFSRITRREIGEAIIKSETKDHHDEVNPNKKTAGL